MITFVCTEVLTLLLSLETVGSTRTAEDWEDTDTFCCGKINRDALHRVLLFFSFIILSIYPFSKILKFKQQSFKLSISLNYIIWSLMRNGSFWHMESSTLCSFLQELFCFHLSVCARVQIRLQAIAN